MEKKILITNIGNRNLLIHGETLRATNYGNEITEDSFFYRTKKLHEAKNYANLSVSILPALLEELKDQIEKVILIATLQEPVHSQDSYFAAMLIQDILQEIFPAINFEVFPLRKPVIDNFGLLNFYRNFLKPFQNTSQKIIITDAGGSTQQKITLKLAAEYMLSSTQFEVYNTYARGNRTVIERGLNYEFRTTLEKESVLLLLKEYDFWGARVLLKNIEPNHPAVAYLLFLYHRVALRFEEARKVAQENKEKILPYEPSLNNYIKHSAIGNYSNFTGLVTELNYFILCEFAAVAHFYYINQKLAEAVNYFYLFIEKYTSFVIKKTMNYDSQTTIGREKIRNAIKNAKVRLTQSLPILLNIYLCQEIHPNNKIHQNLITHFLKLFVSHDKEHKANLEELYHQVIYNGIALDYEKIRQEVYYLEACLDLALASLEIPSPNIYLRAIGVLSDKL
jgi:hypothetical protein